MGRPSPGVDGAGPTISLQWLLRGNHSGTPRVLPRRRYLATAMALALVLYGVEGLCHFKVRESVNPSVYHGIDAHNRWRTLSRWIDQVGRGLLGPLLPAPVDSSRRAATALYARALAALSRSSETIIEVSAMAEAMMAISA